MVVVELLRGNGGEELQRGERDVVEVELPVSAHHRPRLRWPLGDAPEVGGAVVGADETGGLLEVAACGLPSDLAKDVDGRMPQRRDDRTSVHGLRPVAAATYAPPAETYSLFMRRLKRFFPSIYAISAWNEPNLQSTQPLARAKPGAPRAALYTYVLERDVCSRPAGTVATSRSCVTVAAEPLDSTDNYLTWTTNYVKALKRYFDRNSDSTVRFPGVFGFHPYRSTDRLRPFDSSRLIRFMRIISMYSRPRVWFPEVGSYFRRKNRHIRVASQVKSGACATSSTNSQPRHRPRTPIASRACTTTTSATPVPVRAKIRVFGRGSPWSPGVSR